MVNKIFCATLDGLEAIKIEVEATFSRGLPSFNISGLVSNSIKESQHRVTSALNNSEIELPPLKLNINLSPSDMPKSGSHFDLPIALLIIAIKSRIDTTGWYAFGELGLNGDIKSSSLIYPLLLDISLYNENVKVILPSDKKELYERIPNIEFYFANNIKDCIAIICNHTKSVKQNKDFDFPFITIDDKKFYYDEKFEEDFRDIKGQKMAIFAGIIAAAGFHNIIFEGSPGCGKSMIAKRMRYILPPLSLQEMIESVKIQSFNNMNANYTPMRNFRDPHQGASKSSMIGSATQNTLKPGEVALANNGVLFMDELPYFEKTILEAMREPLQNNKLSVSRVHSKVVYETNFMFIGAMNPCPCGNLYSNINECRCKEADIIKYRQRLSAPFLDRIDMFIKMDETLDDKVHFDSKHAQEIVFNAFRRQALRNGFNKNGSVKMNAKLSDHEIEEKLKIDEKSNDILNQAMSKFGLSYRACNGIKRLARTIADIDDKENIESADILKALSFRRF